MKYFTAEIRLQPSVTSEKRKGENLTAVSIYRTEKKAEMKGLGSEILSTEGTCVLQAYMILVFDLHCLIINPARNPVITSTCLDTVLKL